MKTGFEAVVEEILCRDYSPEGIDEWGDLSDEHQEEIRIEVIDDDKEYENWEEYFFDCNERLDVLKVISRSYVNNDGLFASKVGKEFSKILDAYCKWRVDEIIAQYVFPTEREVFFSDHEIELLEEPSDNV